MPRAFTIPPFYRSPAVSVIKRIRAESDPRRKDLTPTLLRCGAVTFSLARHFGFCFGVEHAIEIAYRALDENPEKTIYLLGEMIHNPEVNDDLVRRGVRFLTDTRGNRLISFDVLQPSDIVIVPAFGTTVEMQRELESRGVNPYFHNATCPFVEKVWKRASDLGKKGYSVVIHGKRLHEETRATFSHSKERSPTVVVRDMKDTLELIEFLEGRRNEGEFLEYFRESVSEGFSPSRDLARVGVVNQTTMLASETQAIAEAIRASFERRFGDSASAYFADTRDTLCYATNENQGATKALLEGGADMGLVVGGFNSSNTSHLVELLEQRMPTFYIRNAADILSAERIQHFDMHRHEILSSSWLPSTHPLKIAITAGASCPDATVEGVMLRVLELVPNTRPLSDGITELSENTPSL